MKPKSKRKPAPQYAAFHVDFWHPFVIVVKIEDPADARADAYSALQSFGRIARIVAPGQGQHSTELPAGAEPVKNASSRGEQWAWIVW